MLVLAAIVAGVAAYFVASTPKTSAGVRFPLSASQQALLAQVPASADAFAYVPSAAVLDAKLRANPVTRAQVEQWTAKQNLPLPWMLGGADLVAWRSNKQTRFAVRLDPLRALFARAYVSFSGESKLLINTGPDESPLGADELQRILALANALPPSDALVVQRAGGRGAFPPMARPSVTAVAIGKDDVVVTSRAARDPDDVAIAVKTTFARSALLTFASSKAPRAIGDLNRLFGAKVSELIADGGEIVLYDIKTGTLLPRPKGVIVVPSTPEREATVDHLVGSAGGLLTTAVANGELLVGVDDESAGLYIKDAKEPLAWPANRWAARIDAARIIPILQKLAGNPGFRLAAPKLYRSAKDLDRWIGALEGASRIEAADSVDGEVEELKVRVR